MDIPDKIMNERFVLYSFSLYYYLSKWNNMPRPNMIRRVITETNPSKNIMIVILEEYLIFPSYLINLHIIMSPENINTANISKK